VIITKNFNKIRPKLFQTRVNGKALPHGARENVNV
jgi:hypothetical protein